MDKEKLKENIIKAFNIVTKNIKKCTTCGKDICEEEYINGDRSCYKCWEA